MSGHFQRKTATVVPRLPFLIHLFTASGAAFALLAGIAIVRGDLISAFVWLGVALIVDGLDGPMARRLSIGDRMPRWSGAALDFVIDYTTYVFLPAMILVVSGIASTPFDLIGAVLVVTGGALYFADTRMKNEDGSFKGFPAVWNMVVLVLMVLNPPQFVTLGVVVVLTVLTFAPLDFVHPVRVKRWRLVTLAMCVGWGVFAGLALAAGLAPPLWIVLGLAVTSLYLFCIGFVHQWINAGRAGPRRGRPLGL
ncbi:phosphatidylcholine synthase [Rhodobium orientis]|uniref:CDP-alcohol phosphatidyltransferase family protein n=1 Tax=Rhodobium orientis TaxID=34017 RepID=UPI0017AAD55E|nr:CDP-alcohol phosphatidyltransferase family protein [Rhodobium orientis]MBB4302277.1 phosphatidylcholine synthase [Rhodobium orientis]